MRTGAIAVSLLLAGAAQADPAPPPPLPPAGRPEDAITSDQPAPDEGSSDEVSPDDINQALLDDSPPKPFDPDLYPTGTVRFGAYVDSDQTTVYRVLGSIAQTSGHWSVLGSLGVDTVSSASVDVRSSPALSKVDVVTSASGRSSTSGGQMTDTRYQLTGGGGWKDGVGHGANLTASLAKETDYTSVSGGVNGSFDVLDRTTTLLGGVTLTDNWISSVLDRTLHHKMLSEGWSAGLAHVVTRDDAVRLRYDGKASQGDQSSPYRSVRFGDWTANLTSHQITFMNTIGSDAGLPERLPDTRISHAGVLEWVHSLAPGVGLHPELRLAHDSWNINSASAGLELRIARPTWRIEGGYRYYAQTAASFFEDKYTKAPSMYTNYTSDKELGHQTGHLLTFDLTGVLIDTDDPNDGRLMFNLQLDAARYQYPGFTLLPSRDSLFVLIGLSWER